MTADYTYAATLVRVVDGDTVFLKIEKDFSYEIDFGFKIKDTMSLRKSATIDFRLMGINAPEKNTPAGPAATVELTRLLNLGTLRVVSYKPDKYGRWLADIFVTPAAGEEIHINKAMIDGGFAVAYNP